MAVDIRACCGSLVFTPSSNFSTNDMPSTRICFLNEDPFKLFIYSFATIETGAAYSCDVSMPHFAYKVLFCLLAKMDATTYLTKKASVPLVASSIMHLLAPTLPCVSYKASKNFLVVISFPSANMNRSLLLGSHEVKSKFALVKDKILPCPKASRRTSYF